MAKKIVKKHKASPIEELLHEISVETETFNDHANDFIAGDTDAGLKARQSSNALTVMFKEFRRLSVQK